MPTWWGRKSCKNKDDNHKGIISTDRDIKSCVVDPPLTPTRVGTPRCSREFAGASSAFSDSTEKKGHPLPRPLLSPVSIHHQDHVSGSTSGSTSVSSVSSSGSADDQSQLVASRFAFSLFSSYSMELCIFNGSRTS